MGAAPDAFRSGSHPSMCHWACFSSFCLGLLVPPLEFCPQHIGLLFAISGLRLPLLIMLRALPVFLGSFSHLFPFSFLSCLPSERVLGLGY